MSVPAGCGGGRILCELHVGGGGGGGGCRGDYGKQVH